jgi:hypothetical protein
VVFCRGSDTSLIDSTEGLGNKRLAIGSEASMDVSSVIGPAVVAAGVSGIISIVSSVMSMRAARRIHMEKLEFDRDLAERRFEFENS